MIQVWIRYKKTLPPFQWTEIKDNQTNLFLSSEIELEEAQRILRKEVKGERIKFRKKTIRVEDVFLSAEGHLLKVDLITSGDYTGTLSVKGKPDYDQEEGTMQVLDLEYDLSTDNFWLKTASFLFRKQILKQIKSQLKIPLKDNLQSLLKNLNKQINSFKYTEHLKVKGEVEHLEVFKASVLNNAIQLDFGVQADFEMIWDKNRS